MNAVALTTRRPHTAYRCPCCGARALRARGAFEMCPVCWWEDAGQDERDADAVRAGAGGTLSLRQARRNYLRYGASAREHANRVRRPKPDEM